MTKKIKSLAEESIFEEHFKKVYTCLENYFGEGYDLDLFPPLFIDIDKIDSNKNIVSFNGEPALRVYLEGVTGKTIDVYDKGSLDRAVEFKNFYNKNIGDSYEGFSLDEKF